MNNRDKHTPIALLVVVALVMVAYFAWIVTEMARSPVSSRHAADLFGALGVAIVAGAIGHFARRSRTRKDR